MSQLKDRIASMVHAFDDQERKAAVRALAQDAGALEDRIAELTARINTLTKALDEVAAILQRPAANYRVMQIAEPARRALNIIKQTNEGGNP